MSKNRDKLSLVAAILDAVKPGTTKTRIMYNANLSYTLLQKYLETSLNSGFMRLDGYGYELTENGQKFLMQYKKLSERYSKTQHTIKDLSRERAQLFEQCRENTTKTTTKELKQKSNKKQPLHNLNSS